MWPPRIGELNREIFVIKTIKKQVIVPTPFCTNWKVNREKMSSNNGSGQPVRSDSHTRSFASLPTTSLRNHVAPFAPLQLAVELALEQVNTGMKSPRSVTREFHQLQSFIVANERIRGDLQQEVDMCHSLLERKNEDLVIAVTNNEELKYQVKSLAERLEQVEKDEIQKKSILLDNKNVEIDLLGERLIDQQSEAFNTFKRLQEKIVELKKEHVSLKEEMRILSQPLIDTSFLYELIGEHECMKQQIDTKDKENALLRNLNNEILLCLDEKESHIVQLNELLSIKNEQLWNKDEFIMDQSEVHKNEMDLIRSQLDHLQDIKSASDATIQVFKNNMDEKDMYLSQLVSLVTDLERESSSLREMQKEQIEQLKESLKIQFKEQLLKLRLEKIDRTPECQIATTLLEKEEVKHSNTMSILEKAELELDKFKDLVEKLEDRVRVLSSENLQLQYELTKEQQLCERLQTENVNHMLVETKRQNLTLLYQQKISSLKFANEQLTTELKLLKDELGQKVVLFDGLKRSNANLSLEIEDSESATGDLRHSRSSLSTEVSPSSKNILAKLKQLIKQRE